MDKIQIVKVWIEHPVMDLDQTFSYRLAAGMTVSRGVRVRVPFGFQQLVGFVDETETIEDDLSRLEEQLGYQLKDVIEVIDDQPVLNEELYQLGLWLAGWTIAPTIACFQVMLPKQLKPHSGMGRAVKEYYVELADETKAVTAKQREAVGMLANGPVLRRLFRESYPTVFDALKKNGAVAVSSSPRQAAVGSLDIKPAPYPLTDAQQQAIRQINESDRDVILLHGLTGSGKTEIYMQLAAQVCNSGRQVLILVPEIALTPQMVRRMTERFGSNIAIYHSRLSDQQRYEQYQLVASHQVKIVIGTRSAVFMPFDNLGLIVMDEEHDHSYKQDVTPKYNCRDVAIKRAQTHHCKVILGSATPTLESYARALKNVYQLVRLPDRIHQNLPASHLIDMRQQISQHNYFVSAPLRQAIAQRLADHKQCILLLNRRGFTPIMRCSKCGYVITCPHCDIAMSYHKQENVLMCHTCGCRISIEQQCPECGSHEWMNYGLGTERLTAEIQKMFPQARLLRMDADTTTRKGSHAAILDAFERGEADILIGTQMIAKGLDYPNVTLVGIFNADALLARQDYRSVEVTFDLIVQASGRSGRGDTAGEVYVQAFDCRHYGIALAVKQDYAGFFNEEMKFRHIGQYPPYRYLIAIEFASKDQAQAQKGAAQAAQALGQDESIRLLGPSELTKKADVYRYRLIMQGKDEPAMRQIVWSWYRQQRVSRAKLKISVDVDPYALD